MNILFLGELNELGVKICNSLSLTDNVLAASGKKPKYQLDCPCVTGSRNPAGLAKKHEADAVIYVENSRADMNRVNETLSGIIEQTGCRLVYIKEKSIFSRRPGNTAIAELLCRDYASRFGTQVSLLEPPCLYGEELLPVYFTDVTAQIRSLNEFTPNGAENEFCDCLHVDDFCGAVNSVVHDSAEGYCRVSLQSGYPFPLKRLVDRISNEFRQVTVNPYESETPAEEAVGARQPEGWAPRHSFLEDLDALFLKAGEDDKQLSALKRKRITRRVITALAFVAVFVLSELYIQFITVSSDLQYVDMRLLFVVFGSLLLGKKYGVGAAALCGAASVAQSLLNGYQWYVLFYHVDNWIPLAVYFAVAVSIGMFREKLLQNRTENEA